MNLDGIISNIIFRNEENGYTILKLETSDSDITCVGIMPFFSVGDRVAVSGELIYHDKYGEQINVSNIDIKKPTDKDSIVKYLSSGAIKGVGKKTAESIYEKFGKDSVDIIYDNPEKLLEINGIGKNKLADIKLSTKDSRDSRRSIQYLQSLNISYKLSLKIYKTYGDDTIDIIKSNPYKLIEDIDGVGFKLADNIAVNMNINLISPFRLKSGIQYTLEFEADMNGHTSLEREDLIRKASYLLKVDNNSVNNALEKSLIQGNISQVMIDNKIYIYQTKLLKAEKLVALNLAQRLKAEYPFEISINDELTTFSKEQKLAIKTAFEKMLLVITGGPGTGKTTIIRAITSILKDNNLSYFLMAPTGRAAKRMRESTGEDSYTIHKIIGIKPNEILPEYNEENPLECDYVIVDETSMVDIYLMKSLLQAIGPKTALILVGDSDQLPSVGPGNVLKDILETKIQSIRLKKVFRQASQSNIIVNAHRINEGIYPKLNEDGKDFFFIDASLHDFDKKLVDLVKLRLKNFYSYDPIKDIQILTPSKKTNYGTNHINEILQKSLNDEKSSLSINNRSFKKGDKVMQIRNNYDLKSINENDGYETGVFNGDIGFIEDIDQTEEKVKVIFYDGKLVEYNKEDISDLDLSYAITIHKSQGSEFDCVIIPMMQVSYMLLTRNILYTAITRAKKTVVLLGDRGILKTMIDNNTSNNRYTNLNYWIETIKDIKDA